MRSGASQTVTCALATCNSVARYTNFFLYFFHCRTALHDISNVDLSKHVHRQTKAMTC